ncbi:LegC family aminotransferase [Thalassotalea crassostreae]|uniref:LegC family aminotransferase n=1 Tax=Thalassotalea crassostreae TaxID=1763536 RepID=UPI000838AFCD|nr:LegC family aminotransferase [Thalassotalea crassostreae]
MHNKLVSFIRDLYQTNEFIPLHAPQFDGNEKKYVNETLDSTFVSSVGKFVDKFEQEIEQYTGTSKAIATVNGTASLHVAMYMAGVKHGDLVITQALTFVATCNAIYQLGAEPIFVDVSPVSIGLCPSALRSFLESNAKISDSGKCILRSTNQSIKAVIPMHTFGHPVEMDELMVVCNEWNLTLIEDAAESLGSFYKGKHTGTIGEFGAISFNGNKVITTGGGGMVLCRDIDMGNQVKHITTTAKVPHPYEFFHDQPGFNYRLPNINAALGCAQMESLSTFLKVKRGLAQKYKDFFASSDFQFVVEPEYAKSNYWLNAIICPDFKSREELLIKMNEQGVMARPIWKLMHRLPMFKTALRGSLIESEILEERLINIPSTPILRGDNE